MAEGTERSLVELVQAADRGDADAWNEIVDRYSPLLVTVIRQFRLPREVVEDIAQTVWLRLVEHLGDLRDPVAMPKWIITTARHEALRHLRSGGRSSPVDPQTFSWSLPADDAPVDAALIRGERHQALLAGLAELNQRQRELLLLLIHDPPLSYAEISSRSGIPIGAIGPTRARAMDRLRRTDAITAFLAEAAGDPDNQNEIDENDGKPSGGGRHGRSALG